MKKILTVSLVLFLCCGCSFKKEAEKNEPVEQKTNVKKIEEKEEPKAPEYIDDNQIKVALYDRSNNVLTLQKDFNGAINIKKDITTYQVFFSNEETLTYQGAKFGEYYHNTFAELNPERKYKVGFNLSYTLNDGTKISQNIFNPSTTQTNYDYIEVYLYDSYKHRNDSFYSHIEENEYNDETEITSIKLTAGSKFNDIISKIKLTVFTYDEDDFDEETKEYRGVSSYSLYISDINKTYTE